MRVLLIRNPASRSAPDASDLVAALGRHGAEVVEDERLADRVVVAGGDGTVAPAAATAARLGVPLAVLPAGTANDFARGHGLPGDLAAAVELAATGTATRALELAWMDDRPFVNVAAAGLAPAAARRAAPLKPLLGPLAYAVGAGLAGARERPVRCTALADGAPVFEGDAWQAAVASGGAFGGGSEIAEADPHDGRLDLVVVPATGRLALPRVALAMRRGTVARLDGVLHLRAAAIELRVEVGTPFNVDGEVVHARGLARFTARAGAFALVTGF